MPELEKDKNVEVDESIIERNLKLTPQQRIENHQAALDFFNELKSAGESYYARFKRTPKASPQI